MSQDIEFNRLEGKKEINGLARAAKCFIFLKSAVRSSEAASLCPQASSASLCSWTWTRHSSSAASCFTSGFVCGTSAGEELTDDGGWAPLAPREMWGSGCTAPFGLLIASTPGSSSFLFPLFFRAIPLGVWEEQSRVVGSHPTNVCRKFSLGQMCTLRLQQGWWRGDTWTDLEVVSNLQGRGLLQQPAET